MPSKRKRHPNYKAYLSHQLRILQVKFPFLSSRQIKAKICSSWESFSPEKKDDWCSVTARNNGKKAGSPHIKTASNASSQDESQQKHNSSYSSKPLITSANKDGKKVRFMEPILTMEDLKDDVAQEKVYVMSDVWPIFDDFDTIMAHKLDIEQGEPEDVEITEEPNQWPLFGDFKTILPPKMDENLSQESNELEDSLEEGDIMCNMFDDSKPGLQSKNRVLGFHDPIEKGTRETTLFEDDDQEFFA